MVRILRALGGLLTGGGATIEVSRALSRALAMGRLTAPQKDEGKVRGIVAEFTFRRMVSGELAQLCRNFRTSRNTLSVRYEYASWHRHARIGFVCIV